jgi:imidazolonepropionase-like amidohydrolase
VGGVVYVADGSIVAVSARSAPPPAGFEQVKVLETNGTIYPGLIDLHDHLSYNALQLWDVPKKYANRDQWAKGDTYRKLITGPMKVLGRTPEYVPAIVRYVEAKCLVAGTTTAQGIALASNAGIQRYYRGVVRNVEQTDEPELPEEGLEAVRKGGAKRLFCARDIPGVSWSVKAVHWSVLSH